ncbi:MAG TPA: YncE family protein [Candidatus Angelobacter sp.]|jgi:YVTN family beta-propeller protein|nr:YncE family protein [Candidatus Angelobacter sp.]
MKSRFRALWLLFCTAIFVLLAVGCNDTLRQFIVPVPAPTGNPAALSHAVTLSTNPGPLVNGSDMDIDVSGDSNAGVVTVGPNPVFLGKAGARAFTINSGDVSTPPTVSIYTALLPQSAVVSTVTLPPTSLAPIGGTTSSAGNIYIANSGSNTVDVISGTVLAVTATVPVGTHPVMIAGNASNNKIFVVNQGSNNVTEISTIDNTVVKTIAVGSQPVWGVMSADGLFVFIVNQGDGTVSVIDASLDIVLPCDTTTPSCLPNNSIKVGTTAAPSPNFAFYESTLRRVYVSNTGENSISIIKANGFDLGSNPQVLPAKLADITLTGKPTSVTALADGTRAYAALGNCPAGVNHTNILSVAPSCTGNQVSVIDAVALLETQVIPVGGGSISIDSSSDSSRVYVVNNHDTITDALGTHTVGTISDISTSTNTEVMRKLAPQQNPQCVVNATTFCPVQTPFVVRMFP